ncbi:protein-export chaperone SecB [Staphylococcus shinii]|uniref:protein-export chaperone SecB n=1 Tax=Staphylococcus shinii TaxID=2912228 RepID=UPI003CF9F08C
MSAIIDFQSFRLMDLKYNLETASNKDEEVDKSALRINVGTTDVSSEGVAQLELEVNVSDAGENYDRDIKIIVMGLFKITEQDDYKSEDIERILKVNGTAIMMPFVRSFISDITSFDDSTDHILLPTMNVHAMFDSN